MGLTVPPNLKKTDRIVIGMSGGVDSSVAAALLKQQGYDVVGLFMKNWDETDENGDCPASKDYEDVERVCQQLDMPCYSIEFVAEYREQVFAEFLKQYQAGLTPNPDVLCNREIKFDLFLRKAKEFGGTALATGHYSRLRHTSGKPELIRAIDMNKDQTYFLTAVPGDRFQNVIFPIGHLQKPEVREIARNLALSTHAKKDSTGICFIGERKFRSFLSNYISSKPGKIVDLDGKVVGEHQGSAYYTLGQRKGLALGGEGEPWFVIAKNTEKNELVVVRGEEHPAMYAHELWADEINWIAGSPPAETFNCTAKSRYRQNDQSCSVTIEGDRARVRFDQPQRALTPGQYVVFYQDEVCLGGGIIREVGESLLSLSHGKKIS